MVVYSFNESNRKENIAHSVELLENREKTYLYLVYEVANKVRGCHAIALS